MRKEMRAMKLEEEARVRVESSRRMREVEREERQERRRGERGTRMLSLLVVGLHRRGPLSVVGQVVSGQASHRTEDIEQSRMSEQVFQS